MQSNRSSDGGEEKESSMKKKKRIKNMESEYMPIF